MERIWKSVLAEIEVEVSKPIFHTFFRNTELISLKDSIATISSPTFMNSEYIQKRYYMLIKKALDKVTGENNSLVFVSRSSATGRNTDVGPLFARTITSQKRARPSRIRSDYTFDSFAVSDSNQLAYTAATTIASQPGGIYNPLFLYGSVGVGKTHLMSAIANKILDNNEGAKIIYLTTEEFTNEVVEAIQKKSTSQLRNKFRNTDLLLLDDIQFLSGKDKVQEELFHTFNTLIDKGGQIIFSSDRPPHEIQKIEARLASRFEGGLTVDIQPPDFELRTAILLIKSERFNIELPVELAKIAAERIKDTRALEGFLLKLASFLSTKQNPVIDEKLIYSLVGTQRKETKTLHPDSIIDAVCEYYNVKQTQLKGSKRDASLVRSRHLCMYLLKEEAGLTYVEIGNLLGGRDHTTVMHGVEKMGRLLSKTPQIKEEILFIKQKILRENFA